MLSIFSCVFSHLYIFFDKCLFSSFTYSFKWIGFFSFFDIELYELLAYFGDYSLVGYILKYFLPF